MKTRPDGLAPARAQARRIIHELRSIYPGECVAAAWLLTSHPNLPDAAVDVLALKDKVRLKHALDVVAMQWGYDDWRAIAAAAEKGLTCRTCGSALYADGYCTNAECLYANYRPNVLEHAIRHWSPTALRADWEDDCRLNEDGSVKPGYGRATTYELAAEGAHANASDAARDQPDPSYTLCAYCDHFVDRNDTFGEKHSTPLAAFVHLDNGEKDHDHEAVPSPRPEDRMTLAEWKHERPDLFAAGADGEIGPNSADHTHTWWGAR